MRIRKIAIVVFGALILVGVLAGIAYADPHRATPDSTDRITETQNATKIYELATENTLVSSYTARTTVTNQSGDTVLVNVVKQENQYTSYAETRRFDFNRTVVAKTYRSEHTTASYIGDNPENSEKHSNPRVKSVAVKTPESIQYSFFSGYNASALSVVSKNESVVVLGTTTQQQYSALVKGRAVPENVTGSYRIVVNRSTGRVVSVTENRSYQANGESVTKNIQTTFSNYGETTVSRPNWVPTNMKTYLYDMLSV